MKKNIKKPIGAFLLAPLFLLLLFPSCSRDVEKMIQENTSQKNFDFDELAAVQDAKGLYCSLYPSQLRDASELEVASVSYASSSRLRSSDSAQADVCVVNFKGEHGFVVMSPQVGNAPIAVVEQGNFSLTKAPSSKQDSVMHFLIDNALGSDYIREFKQLAETTDREKFEGRGFELVELIEHKTRTRWDQDGLYFSTKEGYLAGCVAVALGQAFAYYKKINNPIFPGISVDLKAIEKECAKNNGNLTISSPEYIQKGVYNLLLWIGLKCNAKYGVEATPMRSKSALKLAQTQGYDTCPSMYKFSAQNVRNGLLDNKLTYMHGSGEERYFIFHSWSWTVDGHAWLADGYARMKSPSVPDRTYELVHVNWGWGGSLDGYFYENVFDAGQEPVVPSGDLRSSNNKYNFQYGVEMSHIFPLK